MMIRGIEELRAPTVGERSRAEARAIPQRGATQRDLVKASLLAEANRGDVYPLRQSAGAPERNR
jgi:hypothetical protein